MAELVDGRLIIDYNLGTKPVIKNFNIENGRLYANYVDEYANVKAKSITILNKHIIVEGEDMAKVDLGQVVGADGKDALIDDTVTGKIAAFSDGADNVAVKSLVAEITPVQSGSGDPSPDNIRPISGRTGLTVTAKGKNLLDAEQTYSGTISNYYFCEFVSNIPLGNNKRIGACELTAGTTYTISFDVVSSVQPFNLSVGCGRGTYGTDLAMVNNYNNGRCSITFTPTAEKINTYGGFLAFRIPRYQTAQTANFTVSNIQLELGSAATAYEPYTAQTYPITWESIAGTVYGGTLDVVSGVLTVDKVLIDLGSITNWRYNQSGAGAFDTNGNLNPIAKNNDCICTNYKVLDNPSVEKITSGDNLVCINKKDDGTSYTGSYAVGTLVVKDSRYSDVEAFKSAMNGVQLLYPLATPQTYQLTPTEVRTILGDNTIYTDAGAVSVEYIADTKLYIDKRLNNTQMMIAGVETSFVATKNYATGDFVIVNDTLYRITAVITSGETITPGTNASETTVAEQFTVKNDTKGSKGDTGATGATGPKGDTGAAGISPTDVIQGGHLYADYDNPYDPNA